jgi:hypothetical protein
VTKGEGAWTPLTKEMIKKLKDKSDPRIASSDGFKKIKADIEKVKKRGKMIIVGDLIKDHEANKNNKDKDKKDVAANKTKDAESDEIEDPSMEDGNLTREERKKKYLERADVNEAVNIAADLAVELKAPAIQVGAKPENKDHAEN